MFSVISDSDMEVLTDPAQEFVQADEDTIKEWTENEKYVCLLPAFCILFQLCF